jgi:hypothetical protein
LPSLGPSIVCRPLTFRILSFSSETSQPNELKLGFIWPSGFGGEDLKKSVNQKQELPVAAMFVNRSGQNEHHHRQFLFLIGSFLKKLLHCSKLLKER